MKDFKASRTGENKISRNELHGKFGQKQRNSSVYVPFVRKCLTIMSA